MIKLLAHLCLTLWMLFEEAVYPFFSNLSRAIDDLANKNDHFSKLRVVDSISLSLWAKNPLNHLFLLFRCQHLPVGVGIASRLLTTEVTAEGTVVYAMGGCALANTGK